MDFTVIPGTDSEILKDSTCPSGFERAGFSAPQIREMCEFVRHCCLETMETAPEKFRLRMPDVLPLYCGGTHATTRGKVLYAGGNVLRSADAPNRTRLLQSIRNCWHERVRGMILYSLNPLMPQPEFARVRCITAHECYHIFLMRSIDSALLGPTEAIVGRLENAFFPPSQEIDPRLWKGTTGFRPPDGASMTLSPAATQVLYGSALTALESVEPGALWQIIDRTTWCGFPPVYPTYARLRDVMTRVLGHRASRRIQSTLPFRPVVAGHHFMIDEESPVRMHTASFTVRRRADFATENPHWQSKLFECTDEPRARLTIRGLDADGRSLGRTAPDELHPHSTFDFNQILQTLTHTDPSVPARITSLQIQMRHASGKQKTINLSKPLDGAPGRN